MGAIRVLPESVANKIAAGEVIERPASIVKELVENSLDAGAKTVEIDIQHGGRSLIRVFDDGHGMDAADAKLAFLRHATSKIGAIEELEEIQSFGFRGEALPSIAAVSRCRLITRQAKASVGTEVVMEGGILKAVQDHPCREGTVVEVRDLFFNTPARRKFLKAESTETGAILDVVSRMALGAPGVGFILRSGDRMLLNLLPTDRPLSRLEALLGEEAAGQFLELDAQKQGIHLRGFLAKPALSRGNRSQIQIYVNGRWVRSLPLVFALQAGYRGMMMEGRYPVAVLFIQLDLKRVDINVHPTKQEVRISQEAEVTGFLQQAVRDTLLRSGDLAPALQMPVLASAVLVREGPLHTATLSAPESWAVFDRPTGIVSGPPPVVPARPIVIKDKLQITRVLGQLHRTFLVAESTDGFVIVDQHAAHERVVYEALLRSLKSGRPERQMLFLDEVLEIHPRQREAMKRSLDLLSGLGFEMEPFGEDTWVVRTAPASLGDIHPVALLQSFLDQVEEGRVRTSLDAAPEAVAALCACKKQSVKAGDPLEPRQIQSLLERLAQCDNPFNCPHGRPVFFAQTVHQLEKQFKRIG